MNTLQVYHHTYIKTKIRTNDARVYTNFRGLNVSDDGVEYHPFTVISTDILHVYKNKYFLKVYSDNFAYKVVDKQMTDYLHENPCKTDED